MDETQRWTTQMKATEKFFYVFQFIIFFKVVFNHKPLSSAGRTVIYNLLN